MIEHVFGGNWTEEKLETLKKYLVAYKSIFDNNPKAQYFTTWYVDAFAGSGSRTPSATLPGGLQVEMDIDDEAAKFLDGSAKIALSIPSPFHKYLFIEASKKRADALRTMVSEEFPSLSDRVHIQVGDANKVICDWCKDRDWTRERAVVFLDPYGMQVEWNTVETLSQTKGVDLWYLFPMVGRLLTHDGKIDDAWSKRLDLLFGTGDWRSRFYQIETQDTLFGPRENLVRDATVSNIQDFIRERLASCFVAVADSRILRNSKASPLFALCFAASNEKGAKPALNIAQHLLKI